MSLLIGVFIIIIFNIIYLWGCTKGRMSQLQKNTGVGMSLAWHQSVFFIWYLTYGKHKFPLKNNVTVTKFCETKDLYSVFC